MMTNSDISPAELYAIQLHNEEPGYYAQIPGVIYHCTYVSAQKKKGRKDHGKIVRRKLRPIALCLYGAIRQMAGQKNVCWASTDTLADWVGCSPGSISEAKEELTQEMEQLGGKSLITVVEKRKRHPNGTGSTTYHHITINFIRGENNAYMSTIKDHPKLPIGIIKPVHNSEAPS